MSEFSSCFAPHIKAMLEWRAATGQGVASMKGYMANFDRFCVTRYPCQLTMTRELVTQWCRENTTGCWDHGRSFAIRGFGKYLQAIGEQTFIVPAEWIAQPARSLPHIFTNDELTALLHAADSLTDQSHDHGMFREYTIPVVFRLMLGAGLRPPEARLLRRSDVDLGERMVFIKQSKRNKDRRIPVSGDLAGLMTNYDCLAGLRRPDREWFFETHCGQPPKKGWLTWNYHQCCRRAGGIAAGSTPYTLRHNYATRMLMRWVEEGKDLGVWLPYLSAYMGHDTYTSTAWYIHLLPERLAATGLTSAAGIIPAVTR
jgi:integrase/recombinase XerD